MPETCAQVRVCVAVRSCTVEEPLIYKTWQLTVGRAAMFNVWHASYPVFLMTDMFFSFSFFFLACVGFFRQRSKVTDTTSQKWKMLRSLFVHLFACPDLYKSLFQSENLWLTGWLYSNYWPFHPSALHIYSKHWVSWSFSRLHLESLGAHVLSVTSFYSLVALISCLGHSSHWWVCLYSSFSQHHFT